MSRTRKPKKLSPSHLPLSEVRKDLSGLLRQLSAASGALGISVHGRVLGYLVAAERFADYEAAAQPARPARLKSSLKLKGDLDQGLAAARAQVGRSLARTGRGLR